MSVKTNALDPKTYHREQYACHLRIRPYRAYLVRESEHERIAAVMTRWLRRCVRDEPVVIGKARISFLDGLCAVAPAYFDVADEHDAEVLRTMVDSDRGQMVEIPRLADER